ncbi:MAG: DNA-processing protein DprA [Acidobacteriia bacterium]|nr:DNA-processing protein DprA [Terriglobia bacterium]
MSAAQSSPEDHHLHWLALALTPSLGPSRCRRLVEHFGNTQAVFAASLTELEAAGLSAAAAQSIALGRSAELAQEEMVRAASVGAQILTLDDPAYPPLLKQIYDPPVALYVRGDASILSSPAIGMVGTRHPTPYGLGMAERLACDLSVRGIIIVSGMARGVDTAAHRGAIAAKAKTAAVFGTGIDVYYPRENSRLAEQILAFGGALVTEFPVGAFAAPQNFPIRNRIISGMSVGVLVVEAGEYSGTRITARCALEQNRELFAVPGNVTNRNSWGPNTLIKQGAKLTATWEDVWEELPNDARLALEAQLSTAAEPAVTASLFPSEAMPPQARKVLALLKQDESTQIDDIVEKLEGVMSSSEIFAALFDLELAGKIRQLPGKNFVKAF